MTLCLPESWMGDASTPRPASTTSCTLWIITEKSHTTLPSPRTQTSQCAMWKVSQETSSRPHCIRVQGSRDADIETPQPLGEVVAITGDSTNDDATHKTPRTEVAKEASNHCCHLGRLGGACSICHPTAPDRRHQPRRNPGSIFLSLILEPPFSATRRDANVLVFRLEYPFYTPVLSF